RYIFRLRAGAYEEDPARFRYLEFVRRDEQNETRLGWRKVESPLRKPEIIEFEFEHPPGVDAEYWAQKRKHMDRGDKNLESIHRKNGEIGTPWGVWVDWFELEGPLPEEENLAAADIFSGRLDGQSDEEFARTVLAGFAEEAFRGEEPSDEFLNRLMGQYEANRKAGQEWEVAMVAPLSIVLSSPSFLYLVEEADEGETETLSARELAVRLAYFLWSSPPDEELLSLASNGKLRDPVVLREQTTRLLADERSQRFVRSFVYQWLEMHRLGMFAFAARDFPTFDNAARDAAGNEIYESFTYLLENGLPLGNLLEADYVIANDVLADYYGIEGVKGHHWRPVPIADDSPRGGLLGSAAVAAMGSDGQRSSPVERGAWVLRKLLNDPPPPAPPNVPQLSRFEGELLSSRALEKAHQEEAQCAQCHQKIDPIGFGMDNLNAAGLWRDVEVIKDRKQAVLASFPIDPSGEFGQGNAFETFLELKDEVAEEVDAFAMGMTESLIAYGLGRPFGFTDHDLAVGIAAHARESEYEIAEFIHALIQSETFQSR
ncbi:MAG: DUF1592 domain-containing protein, partial [Verrucomicrobiota bacterium]